MKEVVVVKGLRTPFARPGTVFKDLSAYELGKIVLRELLEQLELPPGEIDEVIWGNIGQPVEASNIARIIALKAGIPETTPAYTVQRNCASGLQAIISAYYEIASGHAETVIAGGSESISQYPLLFPRAFTERFRRSRQEKKTFPPARLSRKLPFPDAAPLDSRQSVLTDYWLEMSLVQTADRLAKEYRISRQEQDQWALLSHQRADRAAAAGVLKEEIAPVFVPPDYAAVVEADNAIRKELTQEQLAALPPLFDPRYGTVTAGNASPLADGAAALLLMSADRARELGYETPGTLRSFAFVGVNPLYMGIGPAYATAKALKRAGMKFSDIQLTELGEAFAAAVLANERLFGDKKFVESTFGQAGLLSSIDRQRLNPNGGALAIGHAGGASAVRQVLTLLNEMKRRNFSTGLATLCIAGGQGGAIILERK